MSEPRNSRRNFLKSAAGLTAGTVLTREPLWAEGSRIGGSAGGPDRVFPKIDPQFMITPDQAWDWNVFKAEGGPTYAGGAGWKRYHGFPDLEDAGVRRGRSRLRRDSLRPLHRGRLARSTHASFTDSGIAVEKLVTDGTPVPVVASYGMTSGSTPPEGVTAQMLYYDPHSPPAAGRSPGRFWFSRPRRIPIRRTPIRFWTTLR